MPRRFAMSAKTFVARNLAAAFRAGSWSREGLVRRGARACGRRERWLAPLVRRILTAFAGTTPDEDALASFIDADRGFSTAWGGHLREQEVPVHEVFWTTPAMAP